MKHQRQRWWWLYLAGAGAVLAALFVVTRASLDLEAAHQAELARGRAREQAEELRRSALWRLDSRVVPLLAREGARPYFEYLAYYPQECGYTRYLRPVGKGDVLVASPLLLGTPPPFALHFQIDGAGRFSSPQAPEGNQLDLAQATCSTVGDAASFDAVAAALRLQRVQALVTVAALRAAVMAVEQRESAPPTPPAANSQERGRDEWIARAQQVNDVKRAARDDANISNALNRFNEPLAAEGGDAIEPPVAVEVGSLVPWWSAGPAPELFLVRRVRVGREELLQGIWCDWQALRRDLLDSVASLLPGADLEPLAGISAAAESPLAPHEPTALTSIPVRLVAPAGFGAAAPPPLTGWTGTRTTLALAWLAAVAALAIGARLVASSVALARRRHRFASAVTHELRTPLTTFRMYSEMLADGMVSEPEQRQSYLQTLKEQSARLATLVENVLAYARLEERGAAARRIRCGVVALLDRHREALARRAADAGFTFELAVDPSAESASVDSDLEAIGQVLFNLVDNACKYGRGESRATIELTARATATQVEFEVRDHGAGVPNELREAIFEPFERGARNDDARPGVGLGLALARGIARDLGGDLELVDHSGPGALLRLRLPRSN